MKTLKLVLLLLAMGAPYGEAALSYQVKVSLARFDELRFDHRYSETEKAYAAFEYFSEISKEGAKPTSYERCLRSLKVGFQMNDPCQPEPVMARSGNGGTGGVD